MSAVCCGQEQSSEQGGRDPPLKDFTVPWLGESMEKERIIEHGRCRGGNRHGKAYSTPEKQVSSSHLGMSR